jgi:hypothetical protein
MFWKYFNSECLSRGTWHVHVVTSWFLLWAGAEFSKDWMFCTHQWCSKLTLTHTHCCRNTCKTTPPPKKDKKKLSWWDGKSQDACVILGVRVFIYTCTNICPRVEKNLIKTFVLLLWPVAFTHLFVAFRHRQQMNVDWGCWRAWRRGGLEDACWPVVPKFAGSDPADAVGFFKAKNSPARLPSEGK